MRTIKTLTEQEFNLDNVSENEKVRYFTIVSDLTTGEIEAAFADVSKLIYTNESSESYDYGGVELLKVTHDIPNGRYTIEISIDKVTLAIKELSKTITSQNLQIDDLANTIVIMSMK